MHVVHLNVPISNLKEKNVSKCLKYNINKERFFSFRDVSATTPFPATIFLTNTVRGLTHVSKK